MARIGRGRFGSGRDKQEELALAQPAITKFGLEFVCGHLGGHEGEDLRFPRGAFSYLAPLVAFTYGSTS